MKILSFLYVVLFVVFAYLGYSNSIEGSRDYSIARAVVKHTVLAEQNGRFSLDYVCQGTIRMRFDVDANRIQPSAISLRDGAASRLFDIKFEHQPAILAVIGGAGGAWKARELFSVRGMARRSVNGVLAGIAAAASGYSVGSVLARLGQPTCAETDTYFQSLSGNLERFWYASLIGSDGRRDAFVPVQADPSSADFAAAVRLLRRSSDAERRAGQTYTSYDFMSTTAEEFLGRADSVNFWIFWFPLILFLSALSIVGWVIWDEVIPLVSDLRRSDGSTGPG